MRLYWCGITERISCSAGFLLSGESRKNRLPPSLAVVEFYNLPTPLRFPLRCLMDVEGERSYVTRAVKTIHLNSGTVRVKKNSVDTCAIGFKRCPLMERDDLMQATDVATIFVVVENLSPFRSCSVDRLPRTFG